MPVAHYSGSIMRYSFSEAKHTKSCSLIEYNVKTGEVEIEAIKIDLPSGMARIQGDSVQQVLENSDFDKHIDDWIDTALVATWH